MSFSQIMVRAGIVLGALLCLGQMLPAEMWTLTDKQGRDMEVDQLFYDGVNLSVRRVGAYNKIKIAPDLLSKQCWAELSEDMAKDAKITLEVVRRTKTSTDADRVFHHLRERGGLWDAVEAGVFC
ncbi:MAG: hypothetical protein ACI8Z5_001157 [Lentimonas sp.]